MSLKVLHWYKKTPSVHDLCTTITRTKLTDKVRSEITLWKAGLKSLTEAVSITMATLVWKARKEMNTLGFIFEKKPSIKDMRSKYNGKLCQPVPGHPELTSNKMAQIWNFLNLNNAKSIACVRASALEWYRNNQKNLWNWLVTNVIFILF